ncbi:MAG: hypothetical protein P8P48_11035 [Saprospiraceae bacterium]|nr:hypothetical protein [Saprospiraceae bacterium]
MSKRNFDALTLLINALSKAEKRNFKLLAAKTRSSENSMFLQLFNFLDKQEVFNELKFLAKHPEVKKGQLSNLKAHLYKQILQSLRPLHVSDIDLHIREQLDFATILFNKCLYDDSKKLLDKAKSLTLRFERNTLLFEILELEKLLLTKLIKNNIEEPVFELISSSNEVLGKINNINTFKDLSLKLYSFYLKIGFIRNDKDFEVVSSFMHSTLPKFNEKDLCFEEKIHLYNALAGYHFFIQDLQRGYSYAQKWVDLFLNETDRQISNTENYLKAINNLLVAQSKLSLFSGFKRTLALFEEVIANKKIIKTKNIELLIFKYQSTSLINKFFILGDFKSGVGIIPSIAQELDNKRLFLDTHYVLIFYYKFACMYFGNAQYEHAIFWLNEILNTKDVDLRSDVLVFARILNIISHYEMDNTDLMEYNVRSTYRFLLKKGDFHRFQKAIIKFLRRMPKLTDSELSGAFLDLKSELLPLTKNLYEKRSFIYFDIISWLESKIEGRTVQEVIREKASSLLGQEIDLEP